MELSSEDRIRYSRQIAIDEIGKEGQLKLLASAVLVVGCGALGSMVAMQLAGAGVSKIGIVDYDTVDVSNLQRQFFYKSLEVGLAKVDLLQRAIQDLNPGCEVEKYDALLSSKNATELFCGYDFIVDATDNPASKHLIEDMSVSLDKPCCIAGVTGFRGQVMTIVGKSSRFSDIFPDSEDGDFMPCSIGGVAGPVAAMCASLQAAEVIKYLTGAGENLVSKVLVFDLLENRFSLFNL